MTQQRSGATSGEAGTAPRIVICTLALTLMFLGPAHAYVDPGTGSLLIQTIIAVLAGAMATFAGWRVRITQFLRRRKNGKGAGGGSGN